MPSSHPKEIFKATHNTHTISVENLLSADLTDHPLRIFKEKGKGAALFRFTILEKKDPNEKAEFAGVNLRPAMVPGLVKRSDFAINKMLDMKCQHVSGDSSPAYTVKLLGGRMKGRTAMQVLADSNNDFSVLDQQYDYLSARRGVYSNAELQMNAIDDARRIFGAKGGQAAAFYYSLLSLIRPQMEKRHIDKKSGTLLIPVEQMEIDVDSTKDYPFRIQIYSYECNGEEDATGQIVPDYIFKSRQKTLFMGLSLDEWCDLMDSVEFHRNAFRNAYYITACREAAKTE